ncbi:ATP-binding protein [Guptibacillus hwajinpoensis]|uniref:ATP-binding protein n=1 Tax=Guptibacillus hwajinpoensis TaxID=208199 RepID=UPI003D003633
MELQIRPHVRMLSTIGKDLIKDIPAALVELVKNSYDADAKNVNVIFTSKRSGNEENIEVTIEDDGHGMSMDIIKNAWLVPSTDYKVNKKKSESGKRRVQGEKGIGRYASAILGNELTLESVKDGVKSTIYINWDDMEREQFLDNIRVTADEIKTSENNGTKIFICGNKDYLNLWNVSEIEKLEKELRKLISPFEKDFQDDEFNINLRFLDFKDESFEYFNYCSKIEPLPILDMYNYRLSGTIDNSGIAKLTYENNSMEKRIIENISPFKIKLDKNNQQYCGIVEIDLRVYDKDRSNIENIRNKLSSKDNQNYLKSDIKKYLNSLIGTGIYRGGFRIRPHGDRGFDWLNLDNRRVQNPSKHIGLDQLIGFISIEHSEYSKLYDKSSRDGLKDNPQYEGLIEIIHTCLSKIEERRFVFRQQVNKSKNKNVYEKMEDLFDLNEFGTNLKKSIEDSFEELESTNTEEVKQKLTQNINKQFDTIKNEKNKQYEELKEIIAIYQGQATLGNIVTTILHEGRKNLSWFTNQLPLINRKLKRYQKTLDSGDELLIESIKKLDDAEEQTKAFKKLFKKLDPLTYTKRSNKKSVLISKIIDNVKDVFYSQLRSNNISFISEIEAEFTIYGHEEDFLITFTNLVENSIYWLSKDENNQNKTIYVSSFRDNNLLSIIYKDNGPGILEDYIENNSIFLPGFSTKTSGTGLGLAISGEAITRNEGKLIALSSNEGAYFQLEFTNN